MFWVRTNRRIRRVTTKASRAHYEEHKEAAREHVHARLEHFAPQIGVAYNKVFIKNSRSRWGSCSQLRNLNFNYRLVFLSAELADYVVVHELCHLKHFNHSPAFWEEVARVCPSWQTLRQELKKIRF